MAIVDSKNFKGGLDMPNPIIPIKEKSNYNEYLKKIIKQRYGLKLSRYAELVSDEFSYTISESKLSKDFKALNIKRVKEDNVWVYKEIIPDIVDEYSVEFYNYIKRKPYRIRNLECLNIPVHIGSETLVCEKIIHHFKSKSIFCVPGYGCVCIFSKKKKRVDDVEETHCDILEEISLIMTKIYNKSIK